MNAPLGRPRPPSPNRRRLLAWALGLGAAPLAAQTPVYETRDKEGPVFSDRPSPGATTVNVGPTNAVPSTPPPATASAPAPSAAGGANPAAPYRSLAIATPANQGTVHANTGAFEVLVRASPGLRASAGDRIQLMLDGNVLPQARASNRIQLSEADWQAAAAADTAQHTLQAAIVDAGGNVLITSAPTVFYVQRAAVGSRRR
jgi:hypothetical protein